MLRNKIQATIDAIHSGRSSSFFHHETNIVLTCAESLLKNLINTDQNDEALLTEYNHLIAGVICLAQIAERRASASWGENLKEQLGGLDMIYNILNKYKVDPTIYIPSLHEQADSKQLHQCMVEVGKVLADNGLVLSYSSPSVVSKKFIEKGVSISQLTISPMFYNIEQAVSNAATSAFSFFTTSKSKEETVPLLTEVVIEDENASSVPVGLGYGAR